MLKEGIKTVRTKVNNTPKTRQNVENQRARELC